MRISDDRPAYAILTYSILFLFFLQLVTDFIAGIYSFGLLGGGLPLEMAAMVLFLTPFLLGLFRRGLSTTALIVLGELVLFSRALEVLLPTRFQLLVAGVGTGLFLFMFPALLWQRGQKRDATAGSVMAAGLAIAIALSILLRTLGSTMDLTNEGWFRIIPWLLLIGVTLLIPRVFRSEPPPDEQSPSLTPEAGRGKTIRLGVGILAVFTLLFFAFVSPTVISRWTGSNYLAILSMVVLALALFAWILANWGRLGDLSRNVALVLTAVFILALSLTLASNQVAMPAEPSGYPLVDPGVGAFPVITLIVMLLLFPILLLDFGLLAQEIVLSRPSLPRLGLAFGLASLFMLLMLLGNVFTAVWAHVDPVLEPVSRYRFWHVHTIVGLLLLLSLSGVGNRTARQVVETTRRRLGMGVAVVVTIIGAVALLAAFSLSPKVTLPPDRTLKVAGWNIYQGYGVDGQRSHQDQCEVLKGIDADIIGLSESDTARIAGGNFDAPRYLAECLDMYSYIGPKTGIGTFGYALLSSYEIQNPETIHLMSGPGFPSVRDQEQTSGGDQVAVIKAQITVQGDTYHIFVNHFDSYPPREQPAGFVTLLQGLDNVIAIGDYNCEPDTDCYRIISEVLDHCALTGDDPQAAQGKVDHIFVSPGLRCPSFTYVDNTASDHPVVVSDITR
jgi:endonuclease/exonuclease/phosphatase family metal-dependent hydrolase